LSDIGPGDDGGSTTVEVTVVALDTDGGGLRRVPVIVVPDIVTVLPFGQVTVDIPFVISVGGVLHHGGRVPGAGVIVSGEKLVEILTGSQTSGLEVVVVEGELFGSNFMDGKAIPSLDISQDDRDIITVGIDRQGLLTVELLLTVLGEEETESVEVFSELCDGEDNAHAGSVAISVHIVFFGLSLNRSSCGPEVVIKVI